jgi:preprotein translocase subunit SecG
VPTRLNLILAGLWLLVILALALLALASAGRV